MPQLKADIYTTDYIYSLPNGQRAELIDGIIYDMAPPSRIHQKLSGRFYQKIANYIDSKQGTCEVYPAPFAVFLNQDDKTYVEPDISVICDKSKLTDKGCNGAPDFIIEIVSPSSQKLDYNKKNGLYMDSGVREYWIVDPQKECTVVYHYEKESAPTFYPFKQPVPVGIYGDLEITVSDLLE